MENWAKSVEYLTKANKEIRDVIERRDVSKLERFEDQFQGVMSKFKQFKDMAIKRSREDDELQAQLDQNLIQHRNTLEAMKRQISAYKRAIEEQNAENSKLDSELNENVERLHKLNYSSDHNATYSHQVETTSPFIQRLRSELES